MGGKRAHKQAEGTLFYLYGLSQNPAKGNFDLHAIARVVI